MVQTLPKEKPKEDTPFIKKILRSYIEQPNGYSNYDKLEKALSSTQKSLRPVVDSDVRRAFLSLVEIWRRETKYSSLTEEILDHPAYRLMVLLGYDAIPLIIEQLKQDRSKVWCEALWRITGFEPINLKDPEYNNNIIDAWIAWGEGR